LIISFVESKADLPEMLNQSNKRFDLKETSLKHKFQ
jgi:hypothetical protein